MNFASTVEFVWPMLVSAAAWGIAIWALQEPDGHSAIVKRLIGDKSERPTSNRVNPTE